MSESILEQFIIAMRAAGCAPQNFDDIIPDGEDHLYRLQGDRKDKRGGYCLTIEADGFAFGNFRNFKTAEHGKWNSSKGSKKLTKEERTAIDARIKSAEAAKHAAMEKRHAEKAAEAQALWKTLKPAETHPYLETKGIKPHGARLDGEDLIYQGVSGGKVWMYQRIKPDGEKLNQYGAKKKGTYCPFTNASEPKEVILIAEGLATAASIREATGLPTLAAWDAGNLVCVAKEMRVKYPDAKLIICADNDSEGEKNTGIVYAQQAAAKVGGFVVYPESPDGKELDFNDYANTNGLEAVKEKILSVLAERAHEGVIVPDDNSQPLMRDDIPDAIPDEMVLVKCEDSSEDFDDKILENLLIWRKFPLNGDVGKKIPNSLNNILVYFRNVNKYKDMFRYDRFAGRVVLHRQPFWFYGDKFKVREIQDADTSYLTASMERDGLSPSAANVRTAIDVVARENWIDPPLDYFSRIVWDGVDRLDTVLEKYFGATGDKTYLSSVGKKWFISGAARIFSPGCRVDTMLVLEGGQGAMKSTALSVIANVGEGSDEESYFCDTLTFEQISGKDAVLTLQGKLVVEFPELAGLGGREVEEVKSWMSIRVDEIRRPYGREVERFPRRFIAAGTTNESHWLKDKTGNRRFWPVTCGEIDIVALTRDREQLWAEAVHRYKNKEPWWIDRKSEAWETASTEQKARLLDDIWADPISQIVQGHEFITVRDILHEMKIEVKDQNAKNQKQVIDVLKSLGYKPTKRRHNGKTANGWFKELGEEVTF